jgi:biopolymer transport protein TolQ
MPVETAVTPVAAAQLAGTAAAHDMSLLGLFLQADLVVKGVMVLLIVASIVSWAIIFDKYIVFKNAKGKADRFENDFWSADALDDFHTRVAKLRHPHPMAKVFLAAMDEWYRSREKGTRLGSKPALGASVTDRIVKVMSVARNRELDALENGLGFLATVGSTAPFVGLFGTVWGIMNSFTAIAGSQNTSLAIVAPGIAEALFATAIGLFAAIPAVIGYNRFSSELDKFAGKLEDFSVEFHTLLSRQIDA